MRVNYLIERSQVSDRREGSMIPSNCSDVNSQVSALPLTTTAAPAYMHVREMF